MTAATVSTALDRSRHIAPLRRGPAGLRLWALGFAVWTALAFMSVSQTAVFLWSIDQPVRWSWLIQRSLADWYSCAIFTPAYFWMVRRWPLHGPARARPIAIYIAATAAFVVLKYALYVPLLNAIRPDGTSTTLRQTLTGSFISENIAFWCLLAAVLGVEYYRDLREREVQAARLEAQLADARLEALTAQLHPHFLFNTIQGISTLIHRDPEAADEMLARLSDLLRHSLQRDGGHEIPLTREMELLRLYLGVVQSRFADRLTLTIRVPDTLDDALVPHFLLQPLVENALHHGIARRAGAGHIEIAAERQGDALILRVTDDGPGPAPSPRPFPAGGIGLANTRDRLVHLYGDAQRLEIGAAPQGGFQVTVSLPWRVAAEDA
jgi:two-component system, LytTR family, sensor kinase